MDTKDPEAERSLLRNLRAPGEEAGRQEHGTDGSASRTRGEDEAGRPCTHTLRAPQKRKAREGKWETQPGRDVPARACTGTRSSCRAVLTRPHSPSKPRAKY